MSHPYYLFKIEECNIYILILWYATIKITSLCIPIIVLRHYKRIDNYVVASARYNNSCSIYFRGNDTLFIC